MWEAVRMDSQSSEPSPILWGGRAIAAAIGLSEHATFHLLEGGKLPARKVGSRWCADRGALLAYLRGEPVASAA